MKVAVIWTISDFPVYGMLSGWMTAGRLSCLYGMEKTKSFRLKHGKRHSWFDCHRQLLCMEHPFRRNKSVFLRIGRKILRLHTGLLEMKYGSVYDPCQRLLIIRVKSPTMGNLIIG